MKKILICFLCFVLLCGCTAKTDVTLGQKPTVVTTIFPLYDFARAIGANNVNVKMLIKPGSEVHTYDPLPSDMSAVYDSDLFLYIGGESDKWVDSLIDGADINAVSFIDCVSNGHSHNHNGHSHTDEHIWTSSENAIIMLELVCKNLIAIDGKNKDTYLKNFNDYAKKINDASQQINNVVKKSENPFILVADRFPFIYFTKQYGIEHEAAFDGCAVSTDISLKTMSRLTETIKSKNIKTVFCTELSSQNIATALQNEFDINILELHSAHNVSLDDFKNGVTYVDLMHRNAKALERGLVF